MARVPDYVAPPSQEIATHLSVHGDAYFQAADIMLRRFVVETSEAKVKRLGKDNGWLDRLADHRPMPKDLSFLVLNSVLCHYLAQNGITNPEELRASVKNEHVYLDMPATLFYGMQLLLAGMGTEVDLSRFRTAGERDYRYEPQRYGALSRMANGIVASPGGTGAALPEMNFKWRAPQAAA